jgi:tetratricopeptide (TPR) repeat protein
MKNTLLFLTFILFSKSIFSQNEAIDLNDKGIEFAKKGKLDKAFELFDKIIKTYPEYSKAYSNRANIYRLQKKYNLAIIDFSKSIELAPDNLDIIYSRANTYLDSKDFQNAIKDYSTIISKMPSFENIYFDRAYAFIRIENYIEAKNDLESQLKLNPNDFKSLANLINLKKKLKLYDEALLDYDKILKQFPNQPDLHIVYNNRSTLYQDLNQNEKALVDANMAIEIKADYDLGLFNRAGIYLKLGDEKNACFDFSKAKKLGLEENKHFKVDEDYENLVKLCK